MAAISFIEIRLEDGTRGTWQELGGRCKIPGEPMEPLISLENCLKNGNLWDAATSLGATNNDLEAITYSIISFGAVAIVGIIFHGFFIWLISMLKPA